MIESMVFRNCVFFRDNHIEFGWIEGTQKNKLIVVPSQGKNLFLPLNRIAFSWQDKKIAKNSEHAHKSIEIQIKKAESFKKSLELETMHSLLEKIKEYSLDELAENFLDDPKNIAKKLGLFFSLREDFLWFKHNRNFTYTPRTEKELELIKIQILKQKELQKNEADTQKWIQQLESGNWNSESGISPKQQNWLDKLLHLLIEGINSKYWKEMSTVLNWGSTMGINEENSIKKWLSQAGSPVSLQRLILLRANVHENFSKEIFSEVENICKTPLVNKKIFPQNILTYTIDSQKTFDFDDAFSVLAWNKEVLKIAIHITDLTYNIRPGDPLFKEAESRISSVYTIEESFPMLPEKLSNDTFSLKAGKYKNVISFVFQLSNTGDWELMDIECRKIKVNKNLSYEEANKFIEEEKDFWGLLNQFCLKSQENRIEKGALNIARKEFDFDISDPKNIIIKTLNRNSPANRIIEELAISVNKATGSLFHKSDFPGIYRTQSSYEIIKEIEKETTLSMEHLRINPTKLSTSPDKHAGLGCEFYMQVTSPIRRFMDLIIQLQLKLLIEKKDPFFSKEDMMHWSEVISTRQRKYKKAELEIIKHWKLKYLKQHAEEVFLAKIRRKLSNGNIEIELLELDFIIASSGIVSHKDGEEIFLKIKSVSFDPQKLEVKSLTPGIENKIHSLGKKT